MKTLKKIQIVATVVAMLVAVSLADSMNPTSSELIASVSLVVMTGIYIINLCISNEQVQNKDREFLG